MSYHAWGPSHPAYNQAQEKRERKHSVDVRARISKGETFTFQLFAGPGTFRAVVLKGSPASVRLCKLYTPAREVERPAPDWLGAFNWPSDLGELGR